MLSATYDKKQDQYRLFYNKYLLPFMDRHKKVLDVGCNAGKLGEVLKKDLDCIVYGIDISPEAVKNAREVLDFVQVGDVERDEIPFRTEKFDVIVFGDVLEHLIDPQHVLVQFKKMLSENGYIVASIPNVANIRMRLKLLAGQWNYESSGILDNMHLRFFTFKTMLELFEASGLRVLAWRSTPGFHFFVGKVFKSLIPATDRLCRLAPGLFANQFVFKLRPI